MNAVKTVLVTLLAGVLSIGIAGLGERWFGDAERPVPADGEGGLEGLPPLHWTDVAGRPLTSDDWAGEPVILHFWATWCPVCRDQLEVLAEARQRHDGGPLRIVGIAIDRREDLERFLAQHPIDYPVVLGDPDAIALARRLGNHLQGLPFLVLFDRDGRRVFARLGPLTAEALHAQLGPLVSGGQRRGADASAPGAALF